MDGTMLALRVLLSLACVVGLIWVLGRKLAGGQARRTPVGPTMQVVGRQALGRHAGVAVVAVGNRRLLLGYGEQQVTMLTELSPVLETPPFTSGAHGASDRATSGHETAHGLPASLTGFVAGFGDRMTGRRHPKTAAPFAMPSLLSDVPTPRPEIDVDALLTLARADATTGHDLLRPAATAATPAPLTARPAVAATDGPLAGSILSPATWRRAVGALQERTVRR